MSEPRSHFIDPDFRTQPKTDRFCCVCYRDLRGACIVVRISLDGMWVIHPDDATDENSELAFVGLGCCKTWPAEFRTPAE